MNIRSIFASLLGILVLIACNKEDTDPYGPGGNATGVAYLSLKLQTQSATRASDEREIPSESTLKTIYLITCDNSENVMLVPGTNNYFIEISNPGTTPGAFKISAESKSLLLIANPGSKLETVIRSINSTSSYTSINAAIANVTMSELTDDPAAITKGFAMINSGKEGDAPQTGDEITTPLIDISGNIKKASDYTSEADAKTDAEKTENRALIKIERLASKLDLDIRPEASLEVKPAGATFAFGNWTLDGLNTTFYPFAKKTLLEVTHNSTLGFYVKNFYTKDPNFTGTVGAGIKYGSVDPDTYAPILVAPYTWMSEKATTYCIENTMDASEQKFGNATRVVIKGTYYPNAALQTAGGDWFNFAGINYENFAALKTAYDSGSGDANLVAACDLMFDALETYALAHSATVPAFTATQFDELDDTQLGEFPNGGEIIKTDKDTPCIRWYQKGLCYYYYQIRHDDVTTEEMAFAKYGVVRNNWYSLMLTSINGAGTPWYPDINNPGPGDPEPPDPIDESSGFLGITIDVAPWIIWEREFGI